MAPSLAARKKTDPTEEPTRVGFRLIPFYGVEFDHPALSGITGVGRTPQDAYASARGAVANRFGSNVEVVLLNPETFERAGVRLA